MAEAGAYWIVERGIGEMRAALVRSGTILSARIEIEDGRDRAGAVREARLLRIVAPGRTGLVGLADGGEALLQPLPPGLTEGACLVVEITREAIGHKRPLCRAVPSDRAMQDGPDLAAALRSDGSPVRMLHSHDPDTLEAAGWSELLDEATTGTIDFAGGALLMALTPAMTVFDVDGTLPPDALAVAGAGAAGLAIRRHDIAGSIGIDLPTTPGKAGQGKAARLAAAAALDAALPPPFERTAVNGFGFLQVVRPQARASLPQMIADDPVGAATRALLRRAERAHGAGARTLSAAPSVVARLQAESDWVSTLQRRTGAQIVLRAVPGLAISAGHVDVEHP